MIIAMRDISSQAKYRYQPRAGYRMARYHAVMSDSTAHYFVEWRKRAKLTQVAAAQAMGITQGYLSEVERGDKRYNQDILEAMARVYDCSIGDLFRDPDDGKAKWAFIFDRIPNEKRDQAVRTAESFADRTQSSRHGE